MASVSVGLGEKTTPWKKKCVLALSLFNLTLIVWVYITSTTRSSMFIHPKEIHRPTWKNNVFTGGDNVGYRNNTDKTTSYNSKVSEGSNKTGPPFYRKEKATEKEIDNLHIDKKCNPINKIVFVKTHKTGSTTMASIFERFGFRKNLTFALPRRGHVFSNEKHFTRNYVLPMPHSMAKSQPHFDILTNHAIYNRKEMEAVVPNAKYITILRDPVRQLESAFGYFEMAKGMGISNHSNPFETFMQNPLFYYTHKRYKVKSRSKNGQLFDLGFHPKLYNDTYAIQRKIHTIDKEFDLVLVTEYFDESLILLKKLLCWSYDDIVYVSNCVRSQSHRFSISDDVEDKIRRWNVGDVLLYDHFNRTFWKRIHDYGPTFKADLQQFRLQEKEIMDRCVDSERLDKHDRREDMFVLNRKHQENYCKDVLRGDVPYTTLLRNKMTSPRNKTKKGGRRINNNRTRRVTN